MSQLESRPEDGQGEPHAGLVALGLICCLPVAIIALVLIAAGGIKPGLLIPALTCGAMIGMLMFITIQEKPRP